MPLSVSNVVKKYKANAKNATTAYVDGINGTTVNPMEQAIKALPRYEEGIRRALAEGRVEAGLRSVSKAQWQDAAAKVGSRRYAEGIDKGEAKYTAWAAAFLPEQERIRADVVAMPDTTLEDRLQRMMEMARRTAELKGLGKRR